MSPQHQRAKANPSPWSRKFPLGAMFGCSVYGGIWGDATWLRKTTPTYHKSHTITNYLQSTEEASGRRARTGEALGTQETSRRQEE